MVWVLRRDSFNPLLHSISVFTDTDIARDSPCNPENRTRERLFPLSDVLVELVSQQSLNYPSRKSCRQNPDDLDNPLPHETDVKKLRK